MCKGIYGLVKVSKHKTTKNMAWWAGNIPSWSQLSFGSWTFSSQPWTLNTQGIPDIPSVWTQNDSDVDTPGNFCKSLFYNVKLSIKLSDLVYVLKLFLSSIKLSICPISQLKSRSRSRSGLLLPYWAWLTLGAKLGLRFSTCFNWNLGTIPLLSLKNQLLFFYPSICSILVIATPAQIKKSRTHMNKLLYKFSCKYFVVCCFLSPIGYFTILATRFFAHGASSSSSSLRPCSRVSLTHPDLPMGANVAIEQYLIFI